MASIPITETLSNYLEMITMLREDLPTFAASGVHNPRILERYEQVAMLTLQLQGTMAQARDILRDLEPWLLYLRQQEQRIERIADDATMPYLPPFKERS